MEIKGGHLLIPKDTGQFFGLQFLRGGYNHCVCDYRMRNLGPTGGAGRVEASLEVLAEVGEEGLGFLQLVIACSVAKEVVATLHNHCHSTVTY